MPFRMKPGRLMLMEPDSRTSYKYTIWFDYTRKQMTSIKEGDLVAVPNFNSTVTSTTYSILSITSTMPTHYALSGGGNDIKGYPGYVMEAASNLPVDWMDQEDDSFEDTTKIICTAVPIFMEFVDQSGKDIESKRITMETSLPMLGGEVRLLSTEFTEKIFNNGIDPKKENVMTIGNLIRDQDVEIYARIDDLIKVHFGLFGFTGVGKSNFLSTLISKIYDKSNEKIKIVLFDLMDEYTGLLIDKLLDNEINSSIICIGDKTLPGPVFDYINGKNETKLDEATKSLLNNLLVPKGLKIHKSGFESKLKDILVQDKIRIVEASIERTVQGFLQEIEELVYDESTKKFPTLKMKIEKTISDTFSKYVDFDLDSQMASNMIGLIEMKKDGHEAHDKRIDLIIHELNKIANSKKINLIDSAKITIGDLLNDLNNSSKSSLYIVLSHDPHAMRRFSKQLGYQIYEKRRKNGNITPINSFIFDEADEFIPQSASGSYADSSQIIETLARRGRKFGIGIGIATQRITYLNTNIMGQPHTYFISKLPRDSDRERVAEAFAMSKEMLSQTFKFNKGNWLLVSHDATGLDAVPIPIKTENAEDRLKKFLGVDVN